MGWRLHPLSLLTAAACAVLFILIANNIWVSSISWVFCLVLSALTRRWKPFLAGLIIGGPGFIGFGLMYGPFSDYGWEIAFGLGMRFMTATTAGLVIGSRIDLDELMRSIQTKVPAKIVYVIASTTRLYPMAVARLHIIKQTRLVRGVPIRGFRAHCAMVLPLIVGLVDDAAQRSRPLQRTGIGDPGQRTILRPVTMHGYDRIFQVVVVLMTIAGISAAVLL